MRYVLLALITLLLSGVAAAQPPRTLPHDHSTRGKGGDLGEMEIGCIQDGAGNCVADVFKEGTGAADLSGWRIIGLSGANNPTIDFQDSSGTEQALISSFCNNGTQSPCLFLIDNINHGGEVRLRAEDDGGIITNMLTCDPDDKCGIYYDGTEVAQTTSTGLTRNNEKLLIKTSGTTRASTTTASVDPDLQWSCGANERWTVSGYLLASTNSTTADLKILWASGSTGDVTLTFMSGNINATPSEAFDAVGNGASQQSTGVTIPLTSGFIERGIQVMGFIETSGSSGTCGISWAQSASDSNGVIMLENSWIKAVLMP